MERPRRVDGTGHHSRVVQVRGKPPCPPPEPTDPNLSHRQKIKKLKAAAKEKYGEAPTAAPKTPGKGRAKSVAGDASAAKSGSKRKARSEEASDGTPAEDGDAETPSKKVKEEAEADS